MKKYIVISSAALFAACSSLHITPDQRSMAPAFMPEKFTLYGERESFEDKWWQSFESQELDGLISQALGQNLSIEQALARLQQARAVSIQAGSAGAVKVDAEGKTTQGRQRTENNGESSVEDYSLGLSVSYEVDLWGRIAANTRVAELNEAATAEDLCTARMTIAAEVALRWLELAEVRQTITLLNDQVETNKKILGLIELRFKRSQATALDVLQQRQIVAQAENLLPPEKAREQTILHELAVLLGKVPGANLGIKAVSLPEIPVLPATGLPAELLSKRPDIRSSGLRLQSADWTISAAKADRLPALRLTGSARYNSNDFDSVFENWLATLAGSITMPLLDGGYRQAEVERAEAVAIERLASYRETVLGALKEVEDSLSLEKHQNDYINGLKKRLDLAGKTKSEAAARYRKGLETYLPVLTAILEEQRQQRDLVRAEFQQLEYRIQLHRALGGDWMKDEKENKDEQ